MVKRPRATDDASDASHGQRAQKRVRVAADDDGGRQLRNGNGSGKGKSAHPATPRSESGKRMWELTPEELELEEEEFERRESERMQARIEQRRSKGAAGAIADCGVVTSLELKNFMCHGHLTLDFGPQCNFIIGGKSAILSGLTIALGGKAATTGRGTGLKSFIKERSTQAEVTVGILNKGDDAYRNEVYGDVIYVTRTIPREGGSTYKLKNASGHIISRRKVDLTAICDHLNIQVDNPLTVLTQGSSTQFLSSSHPRDKYAFFMKGTLLTQLAQEYELIDEKIAQAQRFADGGKDVLVDLQGKRELANARYAQAERARDMEREKEQLGAELAWAHVAAKQADLEEVNQRLSRAKGRLRQIDQKLEEMRIEHGMAEGRVRAAEAELPDPDERRELEAEKADLNKQIRSIGAEIREYQAEQKQMDRELQRLNKRIVELGHRIEAEARKLAADSQEKLAEIQGRIDACQEKADDAETTLRDAAAELETHAAAKDDAEKRVQASTKERAALEKQLAELTEHINRCMAQQANSLTVYGTNIKVVIQSIRDEGPWATKFPPIGPLGLFVELTDKRWAPALRSYMGRTMMSFVVADVRDRAKLKSILDRTGNKSTPIIISPVDVFDYTKGEPAEGVPTILRALNISNEWAKRVFINAHKLERTGLTTTRVQAQKLCEDAKLSFALAAEDMLMVRVYEDGGGSVTTLSKLNRTDPRQTLFVGSDIAAEIRRLRQEMEAAQQRHRALGTSVQQQQTIAAEARKQFQRVQHVERQAKRDLNQLQNKLRALQEEHTQAAPVSVAGFETSKAEELAARESVLQQFTACMQRVRQKQDDLQPLSARVEDIKRELEFQDAEMLDLKAHVLEATEAFMKLGKQVAAFEQKHDAAQTEIDGLETAVNSRDDELAGWTEKATLISPRVETTRSVRFLETKLDSLKETLAKHLKEHGATIEEISRDLHEAEAEYKRAKKFYKDLSKLVQAAEAALDERRDKWCMFRMFMSLRCKMQFAYHLSCRAFYGKVTLKHSKGELRLEVRTEDQTTASVKDPRALSGGEKSFSTICFLLSLWDCIGSPVRCLDEFDVFMDAVNRKVTMRMIMEAANEADRKQYILISPQGLDGLKILPSVRVLSMSDPERAGGAR
ncbi:P-loop containing nucleoside triphosphate hydrolase protein [Auricularia subglabra TFB-10046 SS5]|nr:P-loop containing nucleoside triphosphate hydrolase protein [Auricularia subglabra TFB-10046 SS5]